jgi:hypothetical protein
MTDEELVRRYNSGTTIRRLAADAGISYSAAYGRLRKTVKIRRPWISDPATGVWTCKRGHSGNFRVNQRGIKECRGCHRLHSNKYNLKDGYRHIHSRVERLPANYKPAHKWIGTHGGAKELCQSCQHDGSVNRLEWANISHEYLRQRSDWLVLCKPCHWQFDNGGLALEQIIDQFPDRPYNEEI